jgi:photosystem II stability/assembly factor-like uncharacterized protein
MRSGWCVSQFVPKCVRAWKKRTAHASVAHPLATLISVIALTLLASCGGGGGSGSGSRTEPAPTVTRLTQTPAEPWKNGVVTFETQCFGSGGLSYEWDLGDGTRKTTADPFTSHSYLSGGDKPVTVTCTDSTRQKTSLGITVSVDPMDLTSVANRTCSTGKHGKGWCMQNPLPTAADLNHVVAIDRVTFWMVGNNGTILKTTDAGASWVVQSSRTTSNLLAIAVLRTDPNIAWIVGENGTILKTQDGGIKWEPQTSGTTISLKSITAVDAQTAWALGAEIANGDWPPYPIIATSVILKTTDGVNWESQGSELANSLYLDSITAIDSTTAWAVGRDVNWTGVILSTTNGVNWGRDTTSGVMSSIASADASTLFAASATSGLGERAIYISTDRQSWTRHEVPAQIPASGMFDVTSIAPISANSAWVFGRNGSVTTILKFTNNNGVVTWEPHYSDNPFNLNSIAAIDSQTVWLVGTAGGILAAADGVRWATKSSGTTRQLFSVAALDANTAWATGVGTIVGTIDGGVTWTPQNVPDVVTAGHNLRSVTTRGATAWAVAWDGISGAVIKTATTPSGVRWETKYSGAYQPKSIAAINAQTVCVAGREDSIVNGAVIGTGTILRTTDAGASWEKYPIPTSVGDILVLDSIATTPTNIAWVLGWDRTAGNYRILKSSNGCITWEVQTDPLPLSTIAAVDERTAWAGGCCVTSNGAGAILKTTDGANWVPQQIPDGILYVSSIAATDATTAWAIGSDSTGQNVILKTMDGITWTTQDPGTARNLRSIAPLGADTAWIVGDDGFIGKTLTGGQ